MSVYYKFYYYNLSNSVNIWVPELGRQRFGAISPLYSYKDTILETVDLSTFSDFQVRSSSLEPLLGRPCATLNRLSKHSCTSLHTIRSHWQHKPTTKMQTCHFVCCKDSANHCIWTVNESTLWDHCYWAQRWFGDQQQLTLHIISMYLFILK